MKFTRYFEAMRQRSDRSFIRLDWIQHVITHPSREVVQPDGETVHNAFFDRSFTP